MEYQTILEDVKHNIIENSQLIKSLEDCCGDTFRNEINNIIKSTIQDRLKIAESIVVLQTKQKRIDSALEKAIIQVGTVDELNKKCTELLQNENKRIYVKNTAGYKEFKKKMYHSIGHDDVAEVAEVTEVAEVVGVRNIVVSMYDPWSKELMVNPVRNTKCGHHYEQDFVFALIKNNNGIRCPVIGCASNAYIQASNLKPDLELREELRAYKVAQDLGESLSETVEITVN